MLSFERTGTHAVRVAIEGIEQIVPFDDLRNALAEAGIAAEACYSCEWGNCPEYAEAIISRKTLCANHAQVVTERKISEAQTQIKGMREKIKQDAQKIRESAAKQGSGG